MNLSRRLFLGGVVATTAAYVTARSFHPVLYGDGLHDDTAALQALFDGKEVTFAREGIATVNQRSVLLSNGVFQLSDRIIIGRGPVATVTNCHFKGAGIALTGDGGLIAGNNLDVWPIIVT